MPFSPPTTYYSLAATGYEYQMEIGTQSSPDSYTAILEIRSIKTNDFTVPAVDVTHLLSPNATEEKIPGLIKPGTIEVTGNFIGDTTQTGIPTLGQNLTLVWWKVTGPVQRGAKTYTASGTAFLNKWDVGPFENNKAIDVSFGLEITGTITYTVA